MYCAKPFQPITAHPDNCDRFDIPSVFYWRHEKEDNCSDLLADDYDHARWVHGAVGYK